jgi:plastocyanin
MNRRRFTWVATSGIASAALVACGADTEEDLTPTRIADVEGAPPTLAPNATPFSSDTGEAGTAAPVEGAGGAITVTALDALAFDPAEISAAPGQEIHVVNGGNLQHDFIVDELGMATELLNGGDEQTITVPDDAEVGASFTYYCSVPGHREAGMEGTITIVEAGAAAAEEAPAEEAAAGGAGEAITVTALDALAFDPSEIEAAPGQEIHVVNGGALQHDFIVDELGMATDLLNGGDEQTITVPEDAEIGQSYTYYCSVPGHREAGMEGTITIVEAGGGEAATPAEEAPAEEAAAGGAPAGPITVNALDALQFDPSEIEAAPGQEIHVVNQGSLQHDFVVDELGMATELLNGGDEQTITVPEDAEVGASFTYYCSVPGHRQAGMEGTITIVEAGGGEAAAATEGEATPEEAAVSTEPVDASQPITVETLDSLAFDPAEIAAAPGQVIRVVNNGTLQHDFAVDEWGLATALLGNGQEDEIQVPLTAVIGTTVAYYCSVPGHRPAGMEGRLTVVEAIEGTAPEAPSAGATPEGEAQTGAVAAGQLELEPDAIRVAALDSMRFAPSQFSAAPGQQIHLVNPGVLVHDIVVDEWELDSGPIGGGEETVFNIPDDAEIGAEVEFYCSVPGHRESGMVGTITIVEADVAQEEAVTPVAEATPAEATPAAAEATPEPVGATPAGATPAAGGGGATAIDVVTVDIGFEPTELTIPADTDVEITVTNEGFLEHDFIIEDTDFATELLQGNGATETITVNLPAGEYTYYCSVPGHREAGMEGTLTVE